jgi:hypothetical protein
MVAWRRDADRLRNCSTPVAFTRAATFATVGAEMTVAEQVESLSRDVEGLRNGDKAAAREEIFRNLSTFIRNLHALTEDALKLFHAANILAPETAELAVEIWDHVYKDFARVSTILERIQRAEPDLGDIVEKPCEIFRDLVEKSALAILEWDARAEADNANPIYPEGILALNAETIAAIEEGKRDDLKSFATVAELMADLNADD